MTALGTTCIVVGVFLWATPIWYPAQRYLLGVIARYRQRRVRLTTPIDWLMATGHGLFLGTLLVGLGRAINAN